MMSCLMYRYIFILLLLCYLQPNLLSAHRMFISKLNVLEVGEELRGKGTTITLFVFSDSLEVTFPFCVHLNISYNVV